jgi:hypothetical protein
MNNFRQFGLFGVSVLLTIFGYFKISNSVEKASLLTSEYIRSVGGSLDTDTALIITEGYIISNMATGGIMLFVGLSSLCFSIYIVCKK